MYENLGNEWGSSVPSFLALACLPMPFLFYMYGDTIRKHSKYALKAQKIQATMMGKKEPEKSSTTSSNDEESATEGDGRAVGPEDLQKVSSIAEKNQIAK